MDNDVKYSSALYIDADEAVNLIRDLARDERVSQEVAAKAVEVASLIHLRETMGDIHTALKDIYAKM